MPSATQPATPPTKHGQPVLSGIHRGPPQRGAPQPRDSRTRDAGFIRARTRLQIRQPHIGQ